MKKIIFVSEICASVQNTNSTHILTNCLLDGLCSTGNEIMFVAICGKAEEEYVRKQYGDKKYNLVLVYKHFFEKFQKYKFLYQIYKYRFFKLPIEKNILRQICSFIDSNTILISHAPSIESIYFCKNIKKTYSKLRYIQYWSDPIVLSGILPEEIGIKRLPLKIIEKYLFTKADEIVFGTRTLWEFQRCLYKKYAAKMRYIDLPYIVKKETGKFSNPNKKQIVYSGNYYSDIRNISPLYETMDAFGMEIVLDIYGLSDLKLDNKKNVFIKGRISPEEIHKVELNADILVCLLNKKCIQIPGKIFYNIDIKQQILIIVDGKYGNKIKEYLKEFNRFVFCDNNIESIKKAITYILNDPLAINEDILLKCSPNNIAMELIKKNEN